MPDAFCHKPILKRLFKKFIFKVSSKFFQHFWQCTEGELVGLRGPLIE